MHGKHPEYIPGIAGFWFVSNTAAKGDMEIEEENRITLSPLLYMV